MLGFSIYKAEPSGTKYLQLRLGKRIRLFINKYQHDADGRIFFYEDDLRLRTGGIGTLMRVNFWPLYVAMTVEYPPDLEADIESDVMEEAPNG